MVDRYLKKDQLLLGMTTIKDYDEYTYHHSVNVSILAVALFWRRDSAWSKRVSNRTSALLERYCFMI